MHVETVRISLRLAHDTKLSLSCLLMTSVLGCSLTPARRGPSWGLCSLSSSGSVSSSEPGSDSVPSYSDSLKVTAAQKVTSESSKMSHPLAALGSTQSHHSRQAHFVSRQAGQMTAGLYGKHAVTHACWGFKRQAMQPDLVSGAQSPEILADPERSMAR